MSGIKIRALYGAGGAVYAVKEAAYTMFILMFYTQVLGLSGTVTGIIISISLIWDGISDPLIGAWSDRLQHRYGRRHPFMALAILPLGLGFIGLFTPPQIVIESSMALAGWLLFWSLWVRTFLTVFAIPHLALSADISSDYQERSQVMGARMFFVFLASLLLPAIALLWIFPTVGDLDGRFVAANYPLYGALSCLVVWIAGITATAGTRGYARSSIIAEQADKVRLSLTGLFDDLLRTFSNHSFRLILGYEVAATIAYGVISTLNILVWTYFWEFSATEVSIMLAVPSMIAIVLVMLSLKPLGKLLEKPQMLQLALWGMILDCLWLYPLKLAGLLPEDNGGIVFVLNFIFMLIFIYCFLLRAINSYSIVTDIVDEHELHHGVRQEGGFFAAMNFIAKLSSIFGPVYGGAALDIIGLKSGMLPGEVPLATQHGLVYALGLGIVPALLVALYFASKIKLTGARVAEIQAEIRQRQQLQN